MASNRRTSPSGQFGHTSKADTLNNWRDISLVLAGAVIVLSLAVLAGWGLNFPPLVSIIADARPTWPLTAVMVLIAGVALAASTLSRRVRVASTILAIVIAAASLVTIASHLSGTVFSHEQMLFTEAVLSTGWPHAGQPALLTAIGLMFISASLVLMNAGRCVLSQQCASLVILLAWIALMGYLFSVPSLYGSAASGHLALNTACAFLLLGIGIFAAQPNAGLMSIITRDSPSRPTLLRLWLLSLLLTLLLGWGTSIAQSLSNASPAIVLALFVTSNAVIISMLIGWSALALQKMEGERQAAIDRLLISQEHLRNLQSLTASLSRVTSVNDAATVIAREGSVALGANAAIAAMLGDDGKSLNIIHSIGYPPEVIEPWKRAPLAEKAPMMDVILRKELLLIESREQASLNYPHLAQAQGLHHAWAILPLIHDGQVVGAVDFAFLKRKQFALEDRAFLLSMAEQCAQAMARARLYEATQRNAKAAVFLATLSQKLTFAHALDERVHVLAERIVAELADWCTINMLEPTGEMRLIGVAHVEPDKANWIRAWAERHPLNVKHNHRLQGVLTEHDITYFEHVDDAVLQQMAGGDGDALRWLRESGTGSMVEVALVSHDKTFGMLKLVRSKHRPPFLPHELALIRDVAQEAAWALDNAKLFQSAMHASKMAERNAERTQRLQVMTALMNKAQTVQQVTEAMVTQGIEAMGARAGFITLFADNQDGSADRDWLNIVAQRGYDVAGSEPSLLPVGRFPVAANTPVNRAIQNASPIWVESVKDLFERFPASARLLAQRDQAWACVPLMYEQTVLGGLALSFEQPRVFGEEDQALFIALAQQCAQALERARLLTTEQKLNGELKDALTQVMHDEHVQRMLARAGELLSAPLDVDQRLDSAARLFVQHMADWCTIEILDREGRLVQQAMAHAQADLQPALQRLKREFPPVADGDVGIAKVIKTGEPVLYREIDEPILRRMAHNEAHRTLLLALGCRSGMMLPLQANGTLLGTMSFMRGGQPPAYTENDLMVACDLAIRLGMAIENARLFEETRALNQHLEKRVAERTTELEKTNEQLRESRRQLRELTRQTLSMVEKERAQVVREVHDELGQSLASVKMALSMAARQIKRGTHDHANASIASAIALIDETIKSIRDLAAHLRPVVLDDLGLVAAIEWQVREFEYKTGIYCDFSSEVDAGVTFSQDVSNAAFRILQEALNNVSRHAQASEVWVTLVANSSGLMLSIRDNGQGMRMEAPASTYGLLSMHERALQLDGQLDIQSAPSHGTSLVLTLPLQGEAQQQSQ